MLSFGVISNPFARITRKNPEFNKQLGAMLAGHAILRVTENTSELAQTVREFRELAIEQVGIVGGDGSIGLVLSAFAEVYGNERLPRFCVLGGGTVNVLARNLGMPRHPLKAMAYFLEVKSTNKKSYEISVPTLIANNRRGFIFANGVAARFLDAFYRNKGSALHAAMFLTKLASGALLKETPVRRMSKGANQLLSEIGGALPTELAYLPTNKDIEEQLSAQMSAVFVSTIPKMAFGIPFFSGLKEGHEFASLVYTSLENRRLATQIFHSLLRRPLRTTDIGQELVKRVQIKTAPGSLWSLDGELFLEPKDGVNIEVGSCVVFLSPYKKACWQA